MGGGGDRGVVEQGGMRRGYDGGGNQQQQQQVYPSGIAGGTYDPYRGAHGVGIPGFQEPRAQPSFLTRPPPSVPPPFLGQRRPVTAPFVRVKATRPPRSVPTLSLGASPASDAVSNLDRIGPLPITQIVQSSVAAAAVPSTLTSGSAADGIVAEVERQVDVVAMGDLYGGRKVDKNGSSSSSLLRRLPPSLSLESDSSFVSHFVFHSQRSPQSVVAP